MALRGNAVRGMGAGWKGEDRLRAKWESGKDLTAHTLPLGRGTNACCMHKCPRERSEWAGRRSERQLQVGEFRETTLPRARWKVERGSFRLPQRHQKSGLLRLFCLLPLKALLLGAVCPVRTFTVKQTNSLRQRNKQQPLKYFLLWVSLSSSNSPPVFRPQFFRAS